MRGKERVMRIGRRLGAGILAVFIAVSSIQVPAGIVYAEEVTAEADENGSAEILMETGSAEQLQEDGSLPDTGNGGPGDSEAVQDGEKAESGEEGSAADNGGTETSGDGTIGDDIPGEAVGDGTGEGQKPEEDSREESPEEPDHIGEAGNPGEREEEPAEEDGTLSDGNIGEEEASEGEKEEEASVSDNDLLQEDSLTRMEHAADSGVAALAESEGPLNLTNLSAEYTALDGSTISSAAQGRPKLLIFYSNTCGHCRSTIMGISYAITDFEGVDICAIETNNKSADEVTEFKQQYGCDEIVFSYDTGMINQNSMWRYVRAAGISEDGKITWPVICYIDADNKLQYVTTGYKAPEDVQAGLKTYCGYTEVKRYQITYILCGGTNHEENPSVYTSVMDTVVLQDASREGHRFEGWYKEAAYSTRVTQIPKGTTSDVTVYAKWSPLSAAGHPEIDGTPADGNLVMGFSGSYYTESADKILSRLNAIRLEACKEGVRNPATGNPLTLADYVPLYWSSDLEAIARLRAAEATVNQDHTRPNGRSCFTAVTSNGEQSWSENLAWNYNGMMQGIEQWYGEKNDWVNQTANAVTGHYKSMINPGYRAVGLGAFRLSSGGWYAVAQEFSFEDTLDAYKDPSQGKCVQYMEVQGSNVASLKFDDNQASFIREGSSYQLSLNVTAKYKDYKDVEKSFSGPYQAGGKWSSSNEEAVVADSMGVVSALAKGTALISVEAGTQSASINLTVFGRDESPILIQKPTKTTYKTGQNLDVTGGKVTYLSNGATVTQDMTVGMLSGFDSSKPGICPVTVVCGGYAASFDTLIVKVPVLEQEAAYGQTLGDILLPVNEYGVYSWQDGTQILKEVGTHSFKAEFTPYDGERFQKLTDLQIEVTTQRDLGKDFRIDFKKSLFTYNGVEQEPEVMVTASDGSAVLSEGGAILLVKGRDYILSYQNNKNSGTATVIVEGMGNYTGTLTGTFEIEPARLVIRAKDKTILIGDKIPAAGEYEYEINGLMAGDSMLVLPVLACDITGTDTAGRYDIFPRDADAGKNYNIFYEKGRLTVASEYVSCAVSFDVQGHGVAPAEQVGIKVGDTIERPEDPSEAGYRFDGWYRDAACTKIWDFGEDIVQADMTLYAKWLYESADSGLAMQEIADMYYTGKACRPAVSVYDGDTLLKPGRDYQIRYYNNINANKDNKRKQGNGEGVYFDAGLPYVEITGKKNYTDTVKVNFNILPASIGDGGEDPAAGIVLKVTEQFTTAKRVQRPFTSIKYGRTMKRDTDYMLHLTAVNVRDQNGRRLPVGLELDNAEIPAGYEGEFSLAIEGMGNYEGNICKSVYVADKQFLMKNTRVTLGSNQKNVVFHGTPVELTPSESDSADTFTVKSGSKILRFKRDYDIKEYHGHDKVGRAEMVLIGIGEYSGEKTVTFNIKGRSFTDRTVAVEGIDDKVYTGRALTQNGVVLTYGKETTEKLQYGKDYTVSYMKNVNKGTAVMIFTGKEETGFTGSFRKSFRIAAADITQAEQAAEMQDITVGYSKAGAKPVEEIILTNQEGIRLINGKDYTLRYTNNKEVAGKNDEKPPTVIVKGRGNYTGEFSVGYNIVKGDLQGDAIKVSVSAVSYQQNKPAEYAYKPSVKVTDGKSRLRAGVDYEITYENNTQADYEKYIQYLEGQEPRILITGIEGSNYIVSSGEPISVLLPIYRNKLKKTNLDVEVEEVIYTGKQVTPAVTVYYLEGDRRTLLTEGEDYTLSYGANVASGKNKGSVTISGVGLYYGGNVTVKFDIGRKGIAY